MTVTVYVSPATTQTKLVEVLVPGVVTITMDYEAARALQTVFNRVGGPKSGHRGKIKEIQEALYKYNIEAIDDGDNDLDEPVIETGYTDAIYFK
jgi:hypothetical protein